MNYTKILLNFNKSGYNKYILRKCIENGSLMLPVLIKSFSTKSSTRKLPAPITLTLNAAERIKELIKDKPNTIGVKIGVKRRGCNGYSYTMNYADEDYIKITKDEKVDAYGVKVFVDPKAIFFLVGTQMDYVETPLSSEFTFENPNSKGSCGCGESFNV